MSISHLDRDSWQRYADRSRPPLAGVRITDVHERLCHPVALQNGMTETCAELFQHVSRKRRRSGHKEPHESADLAARRLLPFEQPDIDGRHAKEQCRFEFLENLLRLRVFESWQHPHPASRDQPAVQAISQSVNMKQRKAEQKSVRAGDL